MRMTQLDTAAAEEEEEEFEEEEGDEDEEGADEAENEGENPAEDGQEEEEKQENDSEDEDVKDDDDDDDEAEKESNDEKDEKESSEEEGSSGEESASDEDEDDGWRIAAKQRNGNFSTLLEMDVKLETHDIMIISNLLHPGCMVLMHVHTVQKDFLVILLFTKIFILLISVCILIRTEVTPWWLLELICTYFCTHEGNWAMFTPKPSQIRVHKSLQIIIALIMYFFRTCIIMFT